MYNKWGCEDVSEDKVNWASCMAMAGDAGDTSEDAGVDPGINVCMEPWRLYLSGRHKCGYKCGCIEPNGLYLCIHERRIKETEAN
jgi:hypothetical protein